VKIAVFRHGRDASGEKRFLLADEFARLAELRPKLKEKLGGQITDVFSSEATRCSQTALALSGQQSKHPDWLSALAEYPPEVFEKAQAEKIDPTLAYFQMMGVDHGLSQLNNGPAGQHVPQVNLLATTLPASAIVLLVGHGGGLDAVAAHHDLDWTPFKLLGRGEGFILTVGDQGGISFGQYLRW